MKRVANIVFNPFTNDSRVLKEAISLTSGGYSVSVIAHGDKGLPKEEEVDGFRVVRFNYLDRSVTKSKAEKLKIYLAWLRDVIGYVKEFDILHCNDLNTLPIAFIVKKFYNKNVKVVYDAHEYETERIHQSSIEKKIAKIIEKFLLRYIDSIITVSPSIADAYVVDYGIKKPTLIYNTPRYIEVEKQDIFREKFKIPSHHLIFLYQGGLSAGRGILEFARLIKDKKDVAYVVMGYGVLEEEIRQLSTTQDNLFFHQSVSPDILLDYTSSADIGVCIEENLCKSWDFALPNKMFEYYIAKLPIIVSGLYEMKKFVKEYDTGYVIEDIFDKDEFDNKFDEIVKRYKDKLPNIDKINQIYNWQEQERVLLRLYKELY